MERVEHPDWETAAGLAPVILDGETAGGFDEPPVPPLDWETARVFTSVVVFSDRWETARVLVAAL